MYAAIVPAVGDEIPAGAERFLADLWSVAPVRVALGSTLAVLLIALSPPFVIGRIAPFHRLTRDQREQLLQRFVAVRFYPVRLAYMMVKMQALVAVLRDERARRALGLPP